MPKPSDSSDYPKDERDPAIPRGYKYTKNPNPKTGPSSVTDNDTQTKTGYPHAVRPNPKSGPDGNPHVETQEGSGYPRVEEPSFPTRRINDGVS